MSQMDEFKDRVFLFIKEYAQCSVREFERRCGLTNGQISSIGVQGPSSLVLSRISETYPELDMNWLFRSTGSMLLSANPDTPRNNVSPLTDIHHNNTVNINYGALKETIIEAIREANRQ